MYVPMPFPYCNRCRKKHPNSYHNYNGCHGLLEIDPSTETVRCTGECKKTWNIWNSEYHCSCGKVFVAKEIKNSVNELIEDCRLCAEELALMQDAYWRRANLAKESKRIFAGDILSSLGYTVSKMAGYTFEKLIDFVLDILFNL